MRKIMKVVCDTPEYSSCRKLNAERYQNLMARMRTGTQSPSGDLADVHALWGYLAAVGAKRAYNICEVFGRLVQYEDAYCIFEALQQHRHGHLRVASIGGGPGTCLLGYVVHERADDRHGELDGTPGGDHQACPSATDATTRLFVFDYASKWEPLVKRVGLALGESVRFGLCDVTKELAHASNADLRAAGEGAPFDLVLVVYCLHESDHARAPMEQSGREPLWAPLLLELWDTAPPRAIFLIKDQRWVEERALELLRQRRATTLAHAFFMPRGQYCERTHKFGSDGLFLLRA